MERIEKSFGENQVLIDVNFVVNAGETHALLGENAAGKSTLMKVLIGVYTADGGRIVLDGKDVTALSLRERLDRGIAEFAHIGGGKVARHTMHAGRIGAVRCQIDLDHRIVEAGIFRVRLPERRIGRQIDDAVVIVGDL